jgi:hypothetical protein
VVASAVAAESVVAVSAVAAVETSAAAVVEISVVAAVETRVEELSFSTVSPTWKRPVVQ